MFWIHGGGNTSGLKDYYDFSELIRQHQVLVVTINYRLGPMGWFTHPAIQGLQNGIDKTSNFGTLDIMEALKWVQSNIQNFGGDPDNITIFGESAGGHNVLSLLASPMGNGLFHKAISQSGYTTSFTKEEAIGITEFILCPYFEAHSKACIPPIDPPITENSFSIPSLSISLL